MQAYEIMNIRVERVHVTYLYYLLVRSCLFVNNKIRCPGEKNNKN